MSFQNKFRVLACSAHQRHVHRAARMNRRWHQIRMNRQWRQIKPQDTQRGIGFHHEGDGTNSLSTRCCDTKATAPAGINAQMSPKGVPKLHIVDGNAQIEKLRFDCAGASGSSVRHAGKHVKSNTNCTQTNTLRIHVFFVKSDTKDCQNGHIFSPHFTMISSVIFKRQKTKRSFGCGISMRAPWTHLR